MAGSLTKRHIFTSPGFIGRIFSTTLALVCVAFSCAPTLAPKNDFLLEGKPEWRCVLHAPKDESAPAPLLVVLHGYAGDAASMGRQWSGQKELAAFYVAAPQAPSSAKKGGAVSTWSSSRDEEYILRLVEFVSRERNVNRSRIMIAGYSAGAGLAVRLAIKHPDIFRACVAAGGGSSAASGKKPATGRFFFLAGGRDGSFNPGTAKRVAEAIQGAGARAEYAAVPNADHAALYSHIGLAAKWLAEQLAVNSGQ